MLAGLDAAALLAATLSIIIAYTWIDATKKSLNHVFPTRNHSNTIRATVIIALVLTIFVIFFVFLLNRTNKMYYTYTGKPLINFTRFNKGVRNRGTILEFWKPYADKKNKDEPVDEPVDENENADENANADENENENADENANADENENANADENENANADENADENTL
jgi:hypothetical protein